MNTTQQTLELLKAALAKPSDEIAKAVTTSTGLVAYDLQAPAKNLYPVQTPLRNSIPRVNGKGGTATNWKVVSALTGSGYDASPWVPEGQRSDAMTITEADKAATYVTIGEEDYVTYEAVSAGRGFEDTKASTTMRLLQKTMIKEEDAILGGNRSVSLGTPSAPSATNAGTGGSIAAATYNVIVVALSYEGYRNSSLANGVATSKTVTGMDGLTFTLKGGSSNKSSAGSTTTSGSTSTISASVTAILGAYAYAWYVGTSGNEKLEAITTINSVKLTALAGTGQNASAISADNSKNSVLAFDGLLSWVAQGLGSYVNTLATGTPGTGTVLTTSGRGSIVEIDTMLKSMWDNNRLSPTVLYVNSQEHKNITDKILSNASGPLLRYNSNGTDPYAIVAGGSIEAYYNPFALNGGTKIPIKIHPTLPAGTILGWCENLPVQYQSNEVPNVAEMHVRVDYYQIDWPLKTRRYETGVYAEEVMAVYAPFALGMINNIANG